MKVNISNEEIDIQFNMAVEIAYEEVAGEPFNFESLSKMKNTMALCMAAIIAANPDTDITMEYLLKNASVKEIGELKNAVTETMMEWLQIPKVIADAEAKEEQPDVNEEQPKN